jgi:hypothetical protein
MMQAVVRQYLIDTSTPLKMSLTILLPASRPKDAHLSNDRLEQTGISTFNVDFDAWWDRHIKPSK